MGRWGRGRNWGSFRFALESIPAADYLRMSYYERWFKALIVDRLLRSDLVTQAELDSGEADLNRPRPTPLPAPTRVDVDVDVNPRFRLEQRVRARNIHPRGHTRLPRYTRDKHGTVVRDHGVFALQDTDANGQSLGRPTATRVYGPLHRARALGRRRLRARCGICRSVGGLP